MISETSLHPTPFIINALQKIVPVILLAVIIFMMVSPVCAGTIKRSYTVQFSGEPVELAGFDETIRLWFAIFTIIFLAMFAGASHAPQIAIVDVSLAWIYLGIGWFAPLIDGLNSKYGAGNGESVLVILFVFATFMAIVWNFREGKRKEKGS